MTLELSRLKPNDYEILDSGAYRIPGKVVGVDSPEFGDAATDYIEMVISTPTGVFLDSFVFVKDIECTKFKTLIKNNQNIPKMFYVSQNYPNPFNPSTSFYIDMPEAGNLSVKVFDVNGRVVKELINTYVNSGRVQARWSGKNEFDMMSPTGIYFLRVETSTNHHVQKLALVK